MKVFVRRCLTVLLLVGVLTCVLRGQTDQPELASIEQLKLEAFKALKGGQFDRTSELLSRAAELSHDPALVQMSQWMQQFQSHRQQLAAERRKNYDKAVADIRTLRDAGFEESAVDRAKDACLLADDKDSFRSQQWVRELVDLAERLAAEAETAQQWLRAQRLYSSLGSIEPANAQWKQKFKLTTQRLRLLAIYAPDQFKRIVDQESARREAAEQLINPSTRPATRPLPEDNDSFRTDWRDMLQGVRMAMLIDALEDAYSNYWREVSYKTLTTGGLTSLKVLATTDGLEKTFEGLADQTCRQVFLSAIEQAADMIAKASPADEGRVMRRVLDLLQAANQQTVQLPEEVLVNEFAEGAFGELDPFSSMIWPADMDEFNKSTTGEFDGVGIQIMTDDEGDLKVVTPLEDSPAYKLGIKAGDIITRIDGRSAKNININQAVKHITGPRGTYVTLTIKSPDGTVKDYTIRRETIHVASVKGYRHLPGGGWDYFIDPAQRIAYLRITNFTKTTEDEMIRALADIRQQGAKGMILDLRNNPGGLLTAATEVCDTFLSGGMIVSTRSQRAIPGPPPVQASSSASDVDLPLVVLVNQFSASASEIVSGALQDHKRALVVGERTFGKGSVQMLFPLAGRSAALKLTTSHYYLPSGRSIHKDDDSTTWGVDPDLVVEMTGEQMRAAQVARMQMEVLWQSTALATAPTTQSINELLAADPQLSAGLLLMRLQLAGATL